MADPFDAVNIPAEEEVVEPQPPANLIDIKLLQEYIKAVCPVLLDAKPDAFQKVLFAPETQKVIEKFVADSKIPVLFIQKRIETTEADNGMARRFFFNFSLWKLLARWLPFYIQLIIGCRSTSLLNLYFL